MEGLALMKGFSLLTLMPAAVYLFLCRGSFRCFTLLDSETYLAGISHEGLFSFRDHRNCAAHYDTAVLYRRFW
ncbi:hypothetical protein PO124_33965 [Bacillus licheniformis]|nr:hypothetical protein [Bacillus licheniformis]